MADFTPGHRALDWMNTVLVKKPERDGHALAQATRCLAEYRDAITPRDYGKASAAERNRLTRVNAILTLVMALHFPIGEAPWDDFGAARQWLSALLAEAPASADQSA